jgi:hypothetical protein
MHTKFNPMYIIVLMLLSTSVSAYKGVTITNCNWAIGYPYAQKDDPRRDYAGIEVYERDESIRALEGYIYWGYSFTVNYTYTLPSAAEWAVNVNFREDIPPTRIVEDGGSIGFSFSRQKPHIGGFNYNFDPCKISG